MLFKAKHNGHILCQVLIPVHQTVVDYTHSYSICMLSKSGKI